MSKGALSVQMADLLDAVDRETKAAIRKDFNAVAKECVQKLKSTSPKRSGSYASGWTVKKEGDDYIVHNKTDYQLTHLLENGHVIRNAKGEYGRTKAHKHIEPVEQWANEELPRRVMSDLP